MTSLVTIGRSSHLLLTGRARPWSGLHPRPHSRGAVGWGQVSLPGQSGGRRHRGMGRGGGAWAQQLQPRATSSRKLQELRGLRW